MAMMRAGAGRGAGSCLQRRLTTCLYAKIMAELNKVSIDRIIKATPLTDFKIEVLTSSGIAGIFDIKPYLKGSAFKQLLNVEYFKLVKPLHLGIAWPDEQDISSDTVVADIKNQFSKSRLL